MRAAAAIACAALLLPGAAQAGLSRAALDKAVEAPPANAAVPLSLRFTDETGVPRSFGDALAGVPSLLVFADFTCRTLCGPMVEFAAAGLARTGLVPGRDFRLLVVGLDPRDTRDDARRLKARHVDPRSPLAAATTVLSGDAAVIRAATAAVGYRYAYDADNDQFAHPAAALVIDPAGRVARVLSPLALDGADLRLALVDAAGGRTGTFADRIRLLCYGHDPATGIYTVPVTRALALGALLTLAALLGGIGLMIRRTREPAS